MKKPKIKSLRPDGISVSELNPSDFIPLTPKQLGSSVRKGAQKKAGK